MYINLLTFPPYSILPKLINVLKLFKQPAVVTLVICALVLVLTSWFRAYTAGTIMVDGHNLQGVPEMVVFASFITALASFSYAYYRLWLHDGLELNTVKMLALVLTVLFSLMLPMLSNDIFSYLVFGDAANKGADVYTNAQCTHFSSFYPYITGIWTTSTCAYGPVVLILAMLATWIAGGKVVLALIVYKVLVLLFAFAFIEAAARVSTLVQSPVRCFTFIVLNPVFLLQGVGQLHPDLIAITFTLCAMYFLLTKKWYWAFVLVALGIATKMNYVLVLPFFVVAMALKGNERFAFNKNMFIGLALVLAALVVAYLPFYTSVATITTPFTFHFFQNPSKCIGEILGDIIYFAPQLLGGHKEQLQNTVNASTGPAMQLFISNAIVKICQVFALCSTLYILIRFIRGEQTLNQWFRVYVRLLLLFLLFYLHIFNPWYLMMFLPFMWVDDEPGFMRWVIVLTCFISVQDIVCSVSRDSVVYVAVLVLTFISVMLYLYKPWRMFFTSLFKKQ